MKKIILFVFILPIALLINTMSAHAAEEISSDVQAGPEASVVYFDDGSRLVISPIYGTKDGSTIKTAANTVTRSRDVYYEDSNGNLELKYTLTATFSYNYGVSSTCTSASYTQTIYDDKWSFSDGSATKSGNTAYGKGHYVKKQWFVVIKDVDIDISLSCDIYGNVK
ncbi:MAG: hypothetical protein J1E01_06800 [Acetatifactor sp.]|nr:hypothetical protein [Acetatifactor sp.]